MYILLSFEVSQFLGTDQTVSASDESSQTRLIQLNDKT